MRTRNMSLWTTGTNGRLAGNNFPPACQSSRNFPTCRAGQLTMAGPWVRHSEVKSWSGGGFAEAQTNCPGLVTWIKVLRTCCIEWLSLGWNWGKYSGYKGLPFTFYVSNAAFMSKLHILKRCLGIFHIHPLANSWTSCLSLSAKTWSIDHLWQ